MKLELDEELFVKDVIPVEVTPESKLADVEEKDQGVATPTYAAAVRDIKKADEVMKEVTEVSEAPEHEEKPDKVIAQKEAKKLHLDESLFEKNLDESSDYLDEPSNYIVTVDINGNSEIRSDAECDPDAEFAEISDMTDTELLNNDLLGAALIYKDDEGVAHVVEIRHVEGKYDLIDKTAQEYTYGKLEEANTYDKVKATLRRLMGKKAEALTEDIEDIENIQARVHAYIEMKLEEAEQDIAQVHVVAKAVPGYNPDWCEELGNSEEADRAYEARMNLAKAWTDVLFAKAHMNENIEECPKCHKAPCECEEFEIVRESKECECPDCGYRCSANDLIDVEDGKMVCKECAKNY